MAALRTTTLATFVAVALVAVVALGAAPAAGSQHLSVAISEDASSVTIEVTRAGEPVPGANVAVASVGNATPFDGSYETDGDGVVVFGEERISDVSGVVHLRITVETETVSTAQLATITRSPDVTRSAPLGQRISMSLQDSVARTRGAVAGTMFVARLESIGDEAGRIDVLRSHADRTLQEIERIQLDQKQLGRRYATGSIDLETFFTVTIEHSGERAMLRQDLETTLRRLDRYDDEVLERHGVEVDDVHALLRRLERDRPLPRGASISSGR